jgi:ABC-2 type transport system ATP-binding protein
VLIIHRGRVIAEGTVGEIVRKAAAPRSGRVHVAAEHADRASAILAAAAGIEEVRAANGQPGWFSVVFTASSQNGATNEALRALIESGISLRSFELEGARLSDAFLAMTEAH